MMINVIKFNIKINGMNGVWSDYVLDKINCSMQVSGRIVLSLQYLAIKFAGRIFVGYFNAVLCIITVDVYQKPYLP